MIIILVFFLLLPLKIPRGEVACNKVCMYVNVFLRTKFTDLLRQVLELKTLT